jgi:amidase
MAGLPAITVPMGFTEVEGDMNGAADAADAPATNTAGAPAAATDTAAGLSAEQPARGSAGLSTSLPAQLPAGLQIAGRAWSEALLFRLAHAYEQSTRHRRPPPGIPPL